MTNKLFQRLKRFDVFRQIPTDLTESSGAGAAVSIICTIAVLVLFMTEFMRYMTVTTSSSMFVESPRTLKDNDEMLRINLEIEVYHIPCSDLSLDLQDIMGSHSVDISNTIKKIKVDENGKHIGGKHKNEKGCILKGHLLTHKVPGNFHISTHANFEHYVTKLGDKTMNISHKIIHLSFGNPLSIKDKNVAYSPLDGLKRITRSSIEQSFGGHYHKIKHAGSYEYYLKTVPTIYQTLGGYSTRSYQFSSSTKFLQYGSFPAIYFRFEFSPITVQFTEKSEQFTTFIVQLFAIIGGVFTGFSLVSTWLNIGVARIMKKANIGKLG